MSTTKRCQSLLIIVIMVSLLAACFPDKKARDHQELMALLQTRQVSGISPYEATRAFFLGIERIGQPVRFKNLHRFYTKFFFY